MVVTAPEMSGDLVQSKRRNKALREFVHQVPPAARQNGSETWCKGDGRTRFCWNSCTKSSPAGRQNGSETWCKGNGRTRVCGDSCTKSPPATCQSGPETWCKGDGRTRFCGNSCTKSPPAGRSSAGKTAAGRAVPRYETTCTGPRDGGPVQVVLFIIAIPTQRHRCTAGSRCPSGR